MRFLGSPSIRAEICEEVLPYFLDLYDRVPGFGYWAAIEKGTGAFLGWFLFRPPKTDPPPGTIELGYRLHTAAWGRGFATRAPGH
jgi:RimJ/RimL family protein N-acetyltransferase